MAELFAPTIADQVRSIHLLVDQLRRLLTGHPPRIQGGALADLTAIWLAGHVCVGDPKETANLREDLLNNHIATVRELIPVNAKAMGTDG